MNRLRGVFAAIIIASAAWLLAGDVREASAQVGYYQGGYRPYSYRSLSRTGKYHGYWRDMGYGFRGNDVYGYSYPPPAYYGGYYYGYRGGNTYPGNYYRDSTPRGDTYYHPPKTYPYGIR